MPQPYQRGSLRCIKRKAWPDRWEYLWRENDETGMRVRRTTVVGTVEQYPTKDLAQAAVNGLRMQVNEDRLRHPGRHIIVADLIDRYVHTVLAEQAGWHSHATRIVYRQYKTYFLWVGLWVGKSRRTPETPHLFPRTFLDSSLDSRHLEANRFGQH